MRSQRGFTALELIIALALIGIVASTAFNVLDRVVPRLRTKQAVMDIAGAIRATRAHAILEKTTASMVFDVARSRYSIAARGAPAPTARESVSTGTRRIVRLPPGVRFVHPPPTSPSTPPISLRPSMLDDTAAEFNPRGLLRSVVVPGQIHVGNPARGDYWRLTVDLAGNVEVHRWDGRKWI